MRKKTVFRCPLASATVPDSAVYELVLSNISVAIQNKRLLCPVCSIVMSEVPPSVAAQATSLQHKKRERDTMSLQSDRASGRGHDGEDRISGGAHNGNQHVQAGNDITGPIVGHGGIHIGDGNSGITITSLATPDRPKETFDIVKRTRIPVSTSVIGALSGILSIIGFVTGASSFPELITRPINGTFTDLSGFSVLCVQFLGSLVILAIALALLGWWKFLRRNILWLPKSPIFRAWAGLKEETGRTYPYALRLAKKCPNCADRNLRFMRVPIEYLEFRNPQTGEITKRVPTKWEARAVCSRYENHYMRINLAGNDFDRPLRRH
ncbi:hypothetical protein E2R33_08130 [Rathayibacter toxicus]|uniref:hypothetical protein n=1 Tax=Rathayibacter toxicus TaxID=145458 RepID=UPI001C04ABAC|nr:hypothetical protein [Rathayibacter toxicus]QWL28565.1 hypothetical protein E2R33_08130 [Rathayibacter toxicus]